MERRTEGSVETVVGDFDAADELLFAAENAQLPDVGRVRVQRSGQIGPLVELVRSQQRYPEAFASVVLEPPFVATVEAALHRGVVWGTEKDSRVGVFPLRRLGPDGERSDLWQLWASRADQAALAVGFPGSD